MTSPVTTIFEPNPSRVRNIFICSGVVFCASSRMMNESLSVRPRMNASGATSIVPRSIRRRDHLGLEHVVERVVERPQVRVDLGEDVAGEEAEALARLDRRAGEDDAVDLLRLQRLHRERDREVALAGSGGADAERDGVRAHRVDVALLPRGLRAHRLAPAQHLGGEHLGRSLVGLQHLDAPADAFAVEHVARLEQRDHLLEETADALGLDLVAADGDLVARARGS